MTDYVLPLLLLTGCCMALHRRESAYDLLRDGSRQGLEILLSLIPTLVLLMTAVSMLRASGAIGLLGKFLDPLFSRLGIPPECGMLVLIRPISGSAALAVGADLLCRYGPDSLIGRTAAVMLGSTETTFYTISVYFGAAGIRRTRYTLPAALLADLTGFLMASLTVRFWSS